MYKLIKILSVIVIVFTLMNMAISVEAAKKNVAIMPIDTNSNTVQTNSESIIYKLVAENMNNQLVTAFHDNDNFDVIDREKVNQALIEASIKAEETVEKDKVIAIGKKVKAQYSVAGKIVSAKIVENSEKNTIQAIKKITDQKSDDADTEISEDEKNDDDSTKTANSKQAGDFEGKITVDLKFINNETGEVVFSNEINSTQVGISGADALRTACKALATDFVKRISTKTDNVAVTETEQQTPAEDNTATDNISVIYVEGDVLYIDKGKDANIKVGDIFIISKKAVPITDMNGNVITVRTMKVGKALVTEVNNNHSICKIIERDESEPDAIKRGCTAKKTDE